MSPRLTFAVSLVLLAAVFCGAAPGVVLTFDPTGNRPERLLALAGQEPLQAIVTRDQSTGLNKIYLLRGQSAEVELVAQSFEEITGLQFVRSDGALSYAWQTPNYLHLVRGKQTELIALRGEAVSLQVKNNILSIFQPVEERLVLNQAILTPVEPRLKLLRPEQADWFKPGATIFVSLKVDDQQNDVSNEAEAAFRLDNKDIEQLLVYNETDGSLSGFIALPEILSNGTHRALVTLPDSEGNIGQAWFNIKIDQTGIGSSVEAAFIQPRLIENCVNGPNPFVPKKQLTGQFQALGAGTVFSYKLARESDVSIKIFDITGTQIWEKRIANTRAGATAWDGEDAFGRISGTGIYPYVFSAKSGGQSENQRGKILIVDQ